MPKLDPKTEPGMVRPSRQIVLGLLLLLAGAAIAVVTVVAGIKVVPGVGLVIAIWGVVILVNVLLGERFRAWPWGPGGTGKRSDDKGDRE